MLLGGNSTYGHGDGDLGVKHAEARQPDQLTFAVVTRNPADL
jgi:hypothetical protein